MTESHRAHIAQGVVTRLRDAPEGRPLREQLGPALTTVLGEQRVALSSDARRELERYLEDRFFGLGPISPLLRDPRVSEIMVNGSRSVWVERDGRLEATGISFADDEEVLVIIERLVAPLGRRIDLAMPIVDARLADGSRVHAVIPPISRAGPILSIRRFTDRPLSPDDLVARGTCSRDLMDVLVGTVRARRSVLVCGGTSSGKTTTLNALTFAIPSGERIVTIEDAAELRLPQPNVVSLETRGPSVEGTGAIDVRALLRAALRMRPDRIVVGEVRGGEALDMLQAMNTGHRGSLTTVHANGPYEALLRLETMCLMAGVELPLPAIRDQIARAIEVIVHQDRSPDGHRQITHVVEISSGSADGYALRDAE